ncbi:hypothetical protein Taro_009005 [Colocasia esculenta]|uniref:Uncharacterized protein n=1 Tax=Colocasia esculenta TaxID=4460 RepID=A0A843U3M0_COLES|nr:hypothetical protein [Colocasia esculenta]
MDLAWSEEEVANQREGPHWGSFIVKGRDFLCPLPSGWIGSPRGFVDSLTTFPMLPSPCVHVCMVLGGPRWSIPWSASRLMSRPRGVAPVGRGLIAARLAVAIRVVIATWFPVMTGRLSRRAAPSHQGYCHGVLPRRDGIVTACGGATVPVLPRVVSVASLCVGVCPRAGFTLRTFW